MTEYYRLIAVLGAQLNLDSEGVCANSGGTEGLTLQRLFVWVMDPLKRLKVLATLVAAAAQLKVTSFPCFAAIMVICPPVTHLVFSALPPLLPSLRYLWNSFSTLQDRNRRVMQHSSLHPLKPTSTIHILPHFLPAGSSRLTSGLSIFCILKPPSHPSRLPPCTPGRLPCVEPQGGALASCLHTHVDHGDPLVRGLVQRTMVRACESLFYMVKLWMFEGELVDHHT